MAKQVMEAKVMVSQPAELVWQSQIKNLQVSAPLAMPHIYKRVEYLQGPPLAPGGVWRHTYADNFEHYDSLTLEWTEMDHENYSCQAKVIDGGFLGKHFDKIHYHYKILPGPNADSCLVRLTFEYEDVGEHQSHNILHEECVEFCKAMEAHLGGKTIDS